MLDVYKSVFNLKGQPFRLSPDHRFSFHHRSYDDAMSYLKYAISQGEGIVAVTGAPGTGKTTLISTLISGLDFEEVNVGVVSNVQLDSSNLLAMVINAFSIKPENKRTSSMEDFQLYLRCENEKGHRVILIVDEAQGLTTDLLEELRLFSNLQHQSKLLLQIFLVGQEPLMDKIHSPGMEQLHQRLIAASQLKSLDLKETKGYVKHRLSCVGWESDPDICDEVFDFIHKFSGGVPRRINLICHRLFLYAGLKNKHQLLGGDALQVIVEMHHEGLLTHVARRTLGENIGDLAEINQR